MASSALTYLEIVNRVLVRLRESTVATVTTTDYSTLISQIVNQVKTEIEEAYRWNALRDTYNVSAVPLTSHYALSSSGMNAEIIDGWNTTIGLQLTRGTNADFNAKFFGTGSSAVQTGPTTMYIAAGYDINYDLALDIWPIPSSTNALKFEIYRPQNDLSAGTDVPLIPQNVLIEETLARAILERGDDAAAQPDPMSAGGKFIRTDLLSKAVMKAQGEDPDEMDWQPE